MADKKILRNISRRNLLKMAGGGVILAGLGVKFIPIKAEAAQKLTKITSKKALQLLMDGNRRYTRQKRTYPDQTKRRITEVAKGQYPFAIVLGCADSRVPPEILFDQGIGDLFVIRVAGNVVNDDILASIEYATAEIGVPLVIVLGHERCGAVSASLKGGELPGHISHLTEAIKPAVEKTQGLSGDPLDNAVKANVQMVVEKLKSSPPILSQLVEQGKLQIVGARYDLDSGVVSMIA